MANIASDFRCTVRPHLLWSGHADGLLLGAALALAPLRGNLSLARIWPVALVLLSGAAIGMPWNSPWAQYNGFAILALLSASLVAKIATDPNCAVTRLLESPALQYLGLISYAFYLWHWPILSFLREKGFSIYPAAALGFVATMFCATLS